MKFRCTCYSFFSSVMSLPVPSGFNSNTFNAIVVAVESHWQLLPYLTTLESSFVSCSISKTYTTRPSGQSSLNVCFHHLRLMYHHHVFFLKKYVFFFLKKIVVFKSLLFSLGRCMATKLYTTRFSFAGEIIEVRRKGMFSHNVAGII